MKSIHDELTRYLVGGLGVLILLGGALLYPAMRGVLVDDFDYASIAKLRSLITLPGPNREGISLSFTERRLPEFEPGENAEFFQVWTGDGAVLARSPSLMEAELPFRMGPIENPSFWALTLPDGRPGRAVGVGVALAAAQGGPGDRQPAPDSEYAIAVVLARDTVQLQRVLRNFLLSLIGGGILWVAVMALIVRRSLRVGLRPVHGLAERAAAIDSTSLKTRFPAGGLPLELRPIAEQLNRLLERVQAAFDREKRFASNVAHELSTPIAELRALAEVSLTAPTDPEASAGLASDAWEIARTMQRTVEMLLAITRSEAGLQQLRIDEEDLCDLVREAMDVLRSRLDKRGLAFEERLEPGVRARVDGAMMRSILFNVFENAVDYSRPDTTIQVELKRVDGGWRFFCANTTDQLLPDDLPHLFEPMWRKDPARSDAAHCGLGLALVRSFATRLRLTLNAALTDPARFEIRIEGSGPEPD